MMKSIGPQMSSATNPPVLVVQEAGGPAVGGTVNLILSLSKTGDSLEQAPPRPAPPEPVHRVRDASWAHTQSPPHPLLFFGLHLSPPPPPLSPPALCASWCCL